MTPLQIFGWLVAHIVMGIKFILTWCLDDLAKGVNRACDQQDAMKHAAKSKTRRASDKLGGGTSNI